MDINQIVVALGAVCGSIVVVGAAISVIKRFAAPFSGVQERVAKLEISHQTTKAGVKVLCKCMLAMMDNAVTGDSVDKIIEARDEMQQYLISRR